MGTKNTVILTKVRSNMFWFWSGVIQHLYSSTETQHGLMFQFSGLSFYQQQDNLLDSFQNLLMRNWMDMTKGFHIWKRYASTLASSLVVSEGMKLSLDLPEQHALLWDFSSISGFPEVKPKEKCTIICWFLYDNVFAQPTAQQQLFWDKMIVPSS